MKSTIAETTGELMSIVVRFVGLFLLFVGLWVAVQVLQEALDLYRNPGNIERLAVAIEQGSNIDKSIIPLKESLEVEEETDTMSSEKACMWKQVCLTETRLRTDLRFTMQVSKGEMQKVNPCLN